MQPKVIARFSQLTGGSGVNAVLKHEAVESKVPPSPIPHGKGV